MSNVLVSLFDESGNMVRPWAEAGWTCFCVDILNETGVENVGKGAIVYLNLDLTKAESLRMLAQLNPQIIFGFPPCTDLAVSGSMHFASKAAKDPKFQIKAVQLAKQVMKLGNMTKAPWFVENPVSVLASMWRKPDHYFHPYEYGMYLPAHDIHPRWPEYIAGQDHYRKKTAIWCGNGFIMPPKRSMGDPGEDSKQHRKLGGKSAKTKQIRSETPRGFAKAVYIHNHKEIMNVDDQENE